MLTTVTTIPKVIIQGNLIESCPLFDEYERNRLSFEILAAIGESQTTAKKRLEKKLEE